MKIYDLKFYGKTYHIVLKKGTYLNNKTLAVEMVEVTKTGKEKDYFGMLTVNLPNGRVLDKDEQFIDTNNNGEKIINFLVENEIAKDTGFVGCSGFCTYPLFKFNEQALAEMEELK